MKATVTSKGQITIPEPIRRRLHLQRGSVLEFDEEADYLSAVPCGSAERIRSVIGIAAKELAGKSAREWIDDLRGPAHVPKRRAR